MPSPPLVVISHAGIDTERARALKARLENAPAAREVGLKIWFDKDDLRAGEEWQKQLEDVIETRASAFVVYVGSKGILNWVDREVRLALSRATAGGRFPFIPVISREAAGSSALPAFARQFQAVRDIENDPAEFSKLLAALLGADGAGRLQLQDEPFFGLKAIDEERSYLFFGREQETAEVLDRLHRKRMVMVIGDSGSGKSSLVNAGVITRWRGGAIAEFEGVRPLDYVWHVVEWRPGRDPWQSLGEAVYEAAGLLGASAEDRGTFLKWVTGNDPALQRQGLRCGLPADTRTLLVVDQFEELVAPRVDVEQRHRFAEFLRALTAVDDPSFAVAMTMRRDYYNLLAAQETRALFDFIESESAARRYLLRRMTDTGLRRIVVEPLKLTDAAPADADLLADAVLGDVGDRPGDLALVQFALTKAWENRQDHGGNVLKSYIAIGRVDGALAREAERIYDRELGGDANETEIAATLIRLAQLSGGGGPVRRVASRREFSESRWSALQLLASRRGNRLVFIRGDDDAADGSIAEIAHEALLTRWPKLFAWVTAAPDDKRVLEDLTDRAGAWADAVGTKKDRQLAKSDAEREAFAGLRERRPCWLSAEETAFVEASVEAHRQRLEVEKAARRRETELRRRATMFALGMAILSLLVGLSAVSLYVALRGTNEALELVNRERLAALRQQSRLLAKQAHESLQSGEMYSAARYAIAGLPDKPEDTAARTRDAERAIQAAGARILTRLAIAGTDQLRALGSGREGDVAAVDRRFGIAQARASQPTPDATISPGKLVNDGEGSGEIAALALSSEGRLAILYERSDKLFALIFDSRGNGRIVAELGNPYSSGRTVAWSADGLCFAFDHRSAVHVWCDGEPLRSLEPNASLFSWAQQGRRLAVGSVAGSAVQIVGEAKGLTERKSLRGLPESNSLSALAWSTDGQLLTAAINSSARPLWTWDTNEEGEARLELKDSFFNDHAVELAWSPDRRLALTSQPSYGSSRVANLFLWNPDDRSVIGLDASPGHGDAAPSSFGDGVSTLTWSADNKLATFVTSGSDRFVQIWLRDGEKKLSWTPLHLERREHRSETLGRAPLVALSWTANGRLAAASVRGSHVDLWSLSAQPGLRFNPALPDVEHAHISDGTVAVTSADGTIVVTGIGSEGEFQKLQGPQFFPDVVAFTPNGKRAAMVTWANQVLWMKSPSDGLQELISPKVERRGPYDSVRIALSADGRRLAVRWANTGVFRIWDVEDPSSAPIELERGVEGNWSEGASFAWSDDGRYLASVVASRTDRARVRVWEWHERTMVPVPVAEDELRPNETAAVVTWSPGGKLAVAVGRSINGRPVERRLLIWASLSMPPSAAIDELTTFKRWDKLVWLGDGSLLAALAEGDSGGLVVAFEGEPMRPRRLADIKEEQVLGFISPPTGVGYGSVLLTKDPALRRFDLDLKTLVDHSDAIPKGHSIRALARSGAIMLSRSGSLSIIDVNALGIPVRLQAEQYLTEAVAVARGGQRVASMNVGGTLRVWFDSRIETQYLSIPPFEYGTSSLAWSPNGAHLAAGSSRSTYVMCDIPNDGLIPTGLMRRGSNALAWSTDHRLAVGYVEFGIQPKLHVYISEKCHGGAEYDVLSIPWRVDDDAHRLALAWSPDGRMLAFVVASQKATTVMAFVPQQYSEPELIELGKIDRPVPRPMLAWSADGNSIAAGAGDGAVFMWPVLAPDEVASRVGSRLQSIKLLPDEMQKAGLTNMR